MEEDAYFLGWHLVHAYIHCDAVLGKRGEVHGYSKSWIGQLQWGEEGL